MSGSVLPQQRLPGRPQAFPPPPYRAPPPGPVAPSQQFSPRPANPPYSKFNVSEPNVRAPVPPATSPGNGQQSGYNRHTINHDNSQQMQHGLKNMLQQQRGSTLDGAGQTAALQHLRNSGLNQDGTYVSPDNLRDAASKMFARNQADRSSFGAITPAQQHFQNQTSLQQHMQRFSSVRGVAPSPGQQDPEKRHSYANHSFRKALQQPKPMPGPKPGQSTSKERLEQLLDQDTTLEAELKNILKSGPQQQPGNRISLSGGNATPPLPALSPGPIPSSMLFGRKQSDDESEPSPDNNRHQRQQQRPDLLGEALNKSSRSLFNTSLSNGLHNGPERKKMMLPAAPGMTPGAIDIENMMAAAGTDVTTDDYEDSTDVGDAAQIRRQLDGLENMYTEVLKLLGLRKFGRHPAEAPSHRGMRRGKMYGSMSSLPSVSSIGSRHLYKDKSRKDAKRPGSGGGGKEKTNNKRFQRLESHVVTLARSVAHLSSELRSQQVLIQEVESLRSEIHQIRIAQQQPRSDDIDSGIARFFRTSNQAKRVQKLTRFFGEEPPLLRIFLKHLGYEKYASILEDSKIGMMELPYVSEDRLEALGIPLGPRLRILQEAKTAATIAGSAMEGSSHQPPPSAAATAGTSLPPHENNYNVYIL